MSNNQIILGPIIGTVTDKNAKVWFYGRCEGIPYCHVYDENEQPIHGSPFGFNPVSTSDCMWKGIPGRAYLTEIEFPQDIKKCQFSITFSAVHSLETEKLYPIETAPGEGDPVGKFSFSLTSCNLGYTSTHTNEKKVGKMWTHLFNRMKDKDCKFHIQCGDQIYCDHRKHNAWEKCKTELESMRKEPEPNKKSKYIENMVNHYRGVYLDCWSFPEIQRVMHTFPQYMIWDDHETTNGWGSNENHHKLYREIFMAARKAYIEFQHSHNPNALTIGELFYTFSYGSASFLVLDLRGHRDYYNDVLLGRLQWQAIQDWCTSESVQRSKILFVVTSVPVFHLSRKFGSFAFIINDLRDQWSTGCNKLERKKLLNLLFDWSGEDKKPVYILGGDVHVGTVIRIDKMDTEGNRTGHKIDQITSSPITKAPAYLLDFFLALFTKRFNFHLDEERKITIQAVVRKRYRRRNFGIVEVDLKHTKPTVTHYMYRERKAEPHVITFED